MRRKLVVGDNGSSESADAVALAAVLARAMDAELVLTTALSPDRANGYGMRDEVDRALGRELADLPDCVEGLPVVHTELTGSPAQVLAYVAEAERAIAVVVGSTHRGRLGAIRPGNVGERLLSGSVRPVAVAPRGFASERNPGLRVIGVAYDGGPEAEEALDAAKALAASAGASMRVIAVAEPGVPRGPLEAALHNAVRRIPSELRAAGELLDGSPAARLLQAVEIGIDLLVIGSRGYGPVRRVLLGGVSARVLRHSTRPVLVVPRSLHGGESGLGAPTARVPAEA